MADALASYISFEDREGTALGFDFQNFHVQQTRSYEGRSYLFAGFGYTGSTVDIAAANIDANLIFLVTDLMISLVEQAAAEEWLCRVKTVWLDPGSFAETSDRLEEVFSVVSWACNQEELVLRLASPLDAQAAELPARVLSRRLVGNLPPSGAISFV
jgi:hypothetical protein